MIINRRQNVNKDNKNRQSLRVRLLPTPINLKTMLTPRRRPILLKRRRARIFRHVMFRHTRPRFQRIPTTTRALMVHTLHRLPIGNFRNLPLRLHLRLIQIRARILRRLNYNSLPTNNGVRTPPTMVPQYFIMVITTRRRASTITMPMNIPISLNL